MAGREVQVVLIGLPGRSLIAALTARLALEFPDLAVSVKCEEGLHDLAESRPSGGYPIYLPQEPEPEAIRRPAVTKARTAPIYPAGSTASKPRTRRRVYQPPSSQK